MVIDHTYHSYAYSKLLCFDVRIVVNLYTCTGVVFFVLLQLARVKCN